MNKIVREHYPVSQLPEDIRKEFNGLDTVRLVVEESETLTSPATKEAQEKQYQAYWSEIAARGSIDYERHRGRTTIEEAVARIRELRDEWDDE